MCAETLWCVRAGSTSSASPQSWCVEPTARSTRRWATRLTATKTRSSWFRGRPSRSRPCCPERPRPPSPCEICTVEISRGFGNHDWEIWAIWAFHCLSLKDTSCRMGGLLDLNTLIVFTLWCLVGAELFRLLCVVRLLHKSNYIKTNYTKLNDLVCFHLMVFEEKFPQFHED